MKPLFRVLFVALGQVVLVPYSFAATEVLESSPSTAECGIYSFIAAAKSLGAPIDVDTVLKGGFVSSIQGSSSRDLCQAAKSEGCWAAAFQNVTAYSVRRSPLPLILNLRTEQGEDCAGHWVAYLGDSCGNAIVFDVLDAGRIRKVSYGELSLLMTGDVVMVGLSPPSTLELRAWRLLSLTPIWPLVIFTIGAYFIRLGPFGESACTFCQASFLLVSAAIVTVLQAVVFEVSPLSEPGIVAWVQSKYVGQVFDEIQFEQLLALQASSSARIVDARPTAAYTAYHIPGAINVPVNSSPTAFESVVLSLSKNEEIIVYCAGEGCDWDKVVARRLAAMGFTKIRVFEQGLSYYVKHLNQAGLNLTDPYDLP